MDLDKLKQGKQKISYTHKNFHYKIKTILICHFEKHLNHEWNNHMQVTKFTMLKGR